MNLTLSGESAGHLAHGQHIHFDDSGHTIMFDQFARFIDVLRGFFAGK